VLNILLYSILLKYLARCGRYLFGDGSLPFSLIENIKFQKLSEINDIALPLKSRATISRKLRERDDEIERQMKALLSSQECLSLHLALDLWQSPSKRHYLGVRFVR
jgi:hypothetical protein